MTFKDHVSTMTESYGFKLITSENWNEPDNTTVRFTCPLDYNEKCGYPPYLDRILKPQLNSEVPIEIRRLFEVARGAMVYSYFFYPLYTLASDQLFRVGEAALVLKSKKIGYSKKDVRLSALIKYLKEKEVFDEERAKRWEALRFLRNKASHRQDQSIYWPAAVLELLENITEDINALYPY